MQTPTTNHPMTPLFPLGHCVATQGTHDLISRGVLNPLDLLSRHQCGDWGELDDSDKQLNQRALRDRSRLMSAYTVSGTKVWVITDADWEVTTLLLPSEY